MATDPNRVKEIFLEAAELPDEAARAAYLVHSCGDDPTLRQRVEALLAAHAGAGSFLEPDPLDDRRAADRSAADGEVPEAPTHTSPDAPGAFGPEPHSPSKVETGSHLPDGVTGTFGSTAPAEPSAGFTAGTAIAGRYVLVDVLGEGGMGTVYRASQTEPVKRQVALKLIKIGMDSRTVLARFDAERQALALMDHPNIARVFDGGTTSMGQPFFVMELVNGVPITDYCDQKRLPVRARLELFVTVCQAVQHAHQKGIIHRDLKPSNVLVTEVDGQPTPKVIDFGVAKATELKLTDLSFADTGAIVGTPAYVSPEQADPSSIDVDTRTDVYSLGVILYELLAGSQPIEAKQFKRGAILEMLRMVREVDPPKPSTKLSTADALPNIAANRHVEPSQLKRALQGDLDWIAMKALEKDRTRRYDTANGFAADVLRHLSFEPVLAAPPSRAYRMKKFVRKNRTAVVAASLVVLALVVGIVGTTWGLIRAENRRMDAERARAAEAERATERDAAIGKAEQEAERARRREADAKQSETTAVAARNDLDKANAALRSSVARSQRQEEYAWKKTQETLEMAGIIRNTMQSKRLSIDASPEIRKLRGEVLAQVRAILTSAARQIDAPDATHAALDLRAAFVSGETCIKLGLHLEARENFEKALLLATRQIDSEPNNDRARANMGLIQKCLGDVALDVDRDERTALIHYRKARELHNEIKQRPHSGELSTREINRILAIDLVRLGRVQVALGQAGEARQRFKEALDYREEWLQETSKESKGSNAEPSSYVMEARMWLGIVSSRLGDVKGVDEHFGTALGTGRALLQSHPTYLPFKIDNAEVEGAYGDALLRLGKSTEAQQQFLESLKHVNEFCAKRPDDVEHQSLMALAHERLGIVGMLLKQELEAKKYNDLARQLRKEAWEIEPSNLSRQMGFVVMMARAGDVANAMRLAATIRPRMKKSTELMLQLARCFALCARADIPEKKNNVEQAMSALVMATRTDYKDATALLTDPDLSSLRDETAFLDLIAKIKMR